MTQRLFSLSDLAEGQCLSFPYGSERGFAVLKDGQLYTYLNRCPHLHIPLEWQENRFLDDDGELIQCSTHGALFLIDTGDCIAGPCAGDRLEPIPVRIENNDVFAA